MAYEIPATRLLSGLASMAAPRLRKDVKVGDAVYVKVKVPNGNVWRAGKITASYPRSFNRRVFDVAVTGEPARMLYGIDELDVRPFRRIV